MKNTIIHLKDLPFQAVRRQIIYIENEYNAEINAFLSRNYEKICHILSSEDLEFYYLPRISEDLYKYGVINYFAPGATEEEIGVMRADDLAKYIYDKAGQHTMLPAMIWWNGHTDRFQDGIIQTFELEQVDANCIKNAKFFYNLARKANDTYKPFNGLNIRLCIRRLEAHDWDRSDDEEVCDCTFPSKKGDKAFEELYELDAEAPTNECREELDPEDYDLDTHELICKAEDIIAKLRHKGVSSYVLEQLIHGHKKLSRIVVTKDLRIILPEYGNMEIPLRPVERALYLFYLKHPEGILFKHLVSHYRDLLDIYEQLRGGKASLKEKGTISALTNPLSNSINEKCSHIKQTFINIFDDRLAKHYYITGEKGKKKSILLDRKMVTWEE
jgi:hypothetical protein